MTARIGLGFSQQVLSNFPRLAVFAAHEVAQASRIIDGNRVVRSLAGPTISSTRANAALVSSAVKPRAQ